MEVKDKEIAAIFANEFLKSVTWEEEMKMYWTLEWNEEAKDSNEYNSILVMKSILVSYSRFSFLTHSFLK